MKKLLLPIITYLILFPICVSAQDLLPEAIVDRVFVDALPDSLSMAMRNRDYEKAYKFALELDQRDSLSYSTLFKCADSMKQLGKYDECLTFCEKWDKRIPEDRYGSIFTPLKAECYFYKQDYNSAVKYLSQYKTNLQEDEVELSPYYLRLYAITLHKLNRYIEADYMYDLYFKESLLEDDLSIYDIYLSENKANFSSLLYSYAYNSFFMGNESKGMNLLNLSSQCGLKLATNDFNHLNKCATVMMDMNLDSGTIYQFEEYVNLYDFKYRHTSDTIANISEDFWRSLLKENTAYLELQAEMAKEYKSKMLQKALNKIEYYRDDMQYYLLEKCNPLPTASLTDSLVGQLTDSDEIMLTDLRVYPAAEANAFATPYGHIYLTSGIVFRCHLNTNLLLGICAHEMTHYLCQHALVNLWKQYEKEHRNQIIGGIAAGLYAVAAIAGAGSRANFSGIVNNSVDLFTVISNASYYFQFKYSRSQEIESDLIAYRFCEAVGIGGYSYIMALQLLGENDLYMKADKTANHPTLSHRIAFLKWLYNKERQLI